MPRDKPEQTPPIDAVSTQDVSLTRRQQEILSYCEALVGIHLEMTSGKGQKSPIKPRLAPLLAAPTGSGKTALVQKLGESIGASYLRVQRGDFYPQGTNRDVPTIFSIINRALMTTGPVLLHLDELDKYTYGDNPAPVQEWSASCYSDLFLVLDRAWPFDAYCRSEHRCKRGNAEVPLEQIKAATDRVFVVGSGTWQTLFDSARKRSNFGFNIEKKSQDQSLTSEEISNSGIIAQELLMRFHSDVQLMPYPDQDEILGFLKSTGIQALADRVGYHITDYDIEFDRGGFRVLETLYTKLLVMEKRREISRNQQSSLPGLSSDRTSRRVAIY